MLINKELIFLGVDLLEKEDVLAFISDKAEEMGVINDRNRVLQAFLLREAEYTTVVKAGIALPHAKSSAVVKPRLIFIKLNQEIPWGSEEFKVQIIFAILVPLENTGKEYLQILSKIATNLLEDEFQRQLFLAEDNETILDIVCNYKITN